MIVLDASAAADAVLERGEQGRWVSTMIAAAEHVHAPHLIDPEVVSALRRAVLLHEASPARARTALEFFLRLRLERYSGTPLLQRVWELRHRLTAYDAMYVALAEALRVPLVTTDARLARSDGHRAEILVYPAD